MTDVREEPVRNIDGGPRQAAQNAPGLQPRARSMQA